MADPHRASVGLHQDADETQTDESSSRCLKQPTVPAIELIFPISLLYHCKEEKSTSLSSYVIVIPVGLTQNCVV